MAHRVGQIEAYERRVGMPVVCGFDRGDRNTYPGAACDVPSFSYCFSFEQKTDWSRKWAPQSEIFDYMEGCVRKYDLLPHIRFNTEVAGAKWDDDACVWLIRTTAGEEVEAEILVSGVGQLNRPNRPKIAGAETFKGIAFHSARWRHDIDLSGKSVGVIGNAASAIQFIPQIASKVGKLHIFQRSANWMIQRGDFAYSEEAKKRYAGNPILTRLYRWLIYFQHEMNWPTFRGYTFLASKVAKAADEYMRTTVRDSKLHPILTPDYKIGGKRILISDDYYAVLNRENVEVVSGGIDRIAANAVVVKDGRIVPVDILIYATGFESTAFLAPMAIQGRGGHQLQEDWKAGARAYLGLSVAGYPNFFIMYGPNTNLGHNSIIFMIECQANYILDCLRRMNQGSIDAIDLRPDVMDEFDARLQRELADTVWATTGKSWYKTDTGRITNNWSGSTLRYWWTTLHANLEKYERLERHQLKRAAEVIKLDRRESSAA